MKKFEKLMLLSASAALSALLTVGCEKKKEDTTPAEIKAEAAQPKEEPGKAATPTAATPENAEAPKGGEPVTQAILIGWSIYEAWKKGREEELQDILAKLREFKFRPFSDVVATDDGESAFLP